MAIFNQLSMDQLKEDGFKYTARFAGIVPVYMTEFSDVEPPTVAVANWFPDWLLPVVTLAWDMVSMVAEHVIEDYDPHYAFLITGEIDYE